MQMINNYAEITRRLSASSTAIATKKTESADKPEHGHLRCLNIISNYVNINFNYTLSTQACR